MVYGSTAMIIFFTRWVTPKNLVQGNHVKPNVKCYQQYESAFKNRLEYQALTLKIKKKNKFEISYPHIPDVFGRIIV